MIIYVDVLFGINFISSFVMIWAVIKCMNLRAKKWRVILSSVVSAVISVLIFCMGERRAALILRLILPFISVVTAVGYDKKHIAAFYLASALSMGISVILFSFMGTGAAMRFGIIYVNLPVKMLFFALIFSYAAVECFARLLKRRQNMDIHNVRICLGKNKVTISAIFDSGNSLKEPLTKKPVIVAQWEGVKSLFDGCSYEEVIENTDKYGLWTIPYKTAGGEGVMYAFLSKNTLLDKKPASDMFIGITPVRLSEKGEYAGLLNNEIII